MLNLNVICIYAMLDIGCYNDKLDLIMLSWKQLCYVGSDYAMLNVIILCWIFGGIMIVKMLYWILDMIMLF